jgi:hypothetical protein
LDFFHFCVDWKLDSKKSKTFPFLRGLDLLAQTDRLTPHTCAPIVTHHQRCHSRVRPTCHAFFLQSTSVAPCRARPRFAAVNPTSSCVATAATTHHHWSLPVACLCALLLALGRPVPHHPPSSLATWPRPVMPLVVAAVAYRFSRSEKVHGTNPTTRHSTSALPPALSLPQLPCRLPASHPRRCSHGTARRSPTGSCSDHMFVHTYLRPRPIVQPPAP